MTLNTHKYSSNEQSNITTTHSPFSLARDPTAAPALADPYLGQSIGPVPGYGVSQQQAHHTEQKQIELHNLVSLPFKRRM